MTVRSLDREEVGWHNITILAMEMSTSYTHANKDTSGCELSYSQMCLYFAAFMPLQCSLYLKTKVVFEQHVHP